MKFLIAIVAALAIMHNAAAADNDFRETTDKALAKGDAAAVVKALEKEAYRGNLVASQELGLMYRDGRVVAQDGAKARKYLKIAAEENGTRLWYRRGMADAQYALAVMLRDGAGGKPDASAARSWFEDAAEQGHAEAQLALAQMYAKGAGITRDAERAFFWSSIAAGLLPEAQQKEAEQLRDQSRGQLQAQQLAKATGLIDAWKPKSI
jgi:TPR repeat protein